MKFWVSVCLGLRSFASGEKHRSFGMTTAQGGAARRKTASTRGTMWAMAAVLAVFASAGGEAWAQALREGSSGPGKTPKPALLVLNKADSTLAIVDPATLKVVGKVATGPTPHEVAASADGKTAITTDYGAKRDGTTLTVIDLASQQQVGEVTFPGLSGPHGIVIKGNKAYFTIEGSKEIGIFDFVAQNIDFQLSIGQKRPHMLVMSKDGKSMYVSNIDSDTVAIEEMKKKPTQWAATIVKVGKGPEGIDLSPDGIEVWAANSGDGTVSIIDTGTRKVTQTVDVKTKHSNRVKFTPNGKLVLISDLEAGDLVVMEAGPRKEVKRIHLGKSPEGILVQPDGSRAFVAVSGDNKVAVVDLKTLEVTGTFETGKEPDGMAWAE